MYDDEAVMRLEQILILRKLNISIKDIQRIFNATGSEIVLDVLGKKVQNIDDEVALLHELKDIVLDFIRKIENIDFGNNADVKQLYDKAKEIETHLANVDYIGKPSNVSRLLEVTEKLDSHNPGVILVRMPKFKAVSNGYYTDPHDDKLWTLWKWIDENENLLPWGLWAFGLDFMLIKNDKFNHICAVKDDVTKSDVSPYELIEFEGGLCTLPLFPRSMRDLNTASIFLLLIPLTALILCLTRKSRISTVLKHQIMGISSSKL